jgi:hypothetical protein
VGGLAAFAALLLLFLLLKKKPKSPVTLAEEMIVSDVTGTINESDVYISQHGLSDEIIVSEAGEDQEDMPRGEGEFGTIASDLGNVSEYNPEDLDDLPDEM